MGKADDITRRASERYTSSDNAKKQQAKFRKSEEGRKEYVSAKSALGDANMPLTREDKKELRKIAREAKGDMTPSDKTFAKMEANRNISESPKKSVCFIATAVYQDENAPQVEALRNYRDDVMMKSLAGRKMIELYYGGLGEGVAYFMRDKAPELIPLARRCLDCFIERVEAIEE